MNLFTLAGLIAITILLADWIQKQSERIDETQAEIQLLQGKVQALEKQNDNKLECVGKNDAK